MHYFNIVTLRTLAVILAIWPLSYALSHLWKTADVFYLLPAVSGLLIAVGLWYLANRMIARQSANVPF